MQGKNAGSQRWPTRPRARHGAGSALSLRHRVHTPYSLLDWVKEQPPLVCTIVMHSQFNCSTLPDEPDAHPSPHAQSRCSSESRDPARSQRVQGAGGARRKKIGRDGFLSDRNWAGGFVISHSISEIRAGDRQTLISIAPTLTVVMCELECARDSAIGAGRTPGALRMCARAAAAATFVITLGV